MLEQAKEKLAAYAGRRVLAAVSGGLDSMCLLHLLWDWGRTQGIVVTAAHFDHRLRENSAQDAAFVRDWCTERRIPCICGAGDVRALAKEVGMTLEEAARTARYEFLHSAAAEADAAVTVTAHHADDNAETMLLNLLRGTGLRGLAGIPAERPGVVRPFRDIPRAALAEYAAAHDLPHVEDETNALDDAARNVLRHRVLPVLRELNSRAVENMTRTAQLLTQDEDALSAAAQRLAGKSKRAENGVVLFAADCAGEPEAVVSRCLLELLAEAAGHRKDISRVHVAAVRGLLTGADRREVCLPYGLTARREGCAVRIFRSEETPAAAVLTMGKTVFFGAWSVRLEKERPAHGIALELSARVLTAPLTVTVWQPEDRLKLPGSRGSRSIKRLCADAGFAPGQRDTLPVLRVNGCAAAMPYIGADADFAKRENETAVYAVFIKETEENKYD